MNKLGAKRIAIFNYTKWRLHTNTALSYDLPGGLAISKDFLDALRSDWRISAVYIHGSYSRGEERAGSDGDLGILPA